MKRISQIHIHSSSKEIEAEIAERGKLLEVIGPDDSDPVNEKKRSLIHDEISQLQGLLDTARHNEAVSWLERQYTV